MGRPLSEFDELRDRPIRNSGYVADTYASAWHSVISTSSFDDAVVDAINRGGDADTVGAVTGMISGRIYGFDAIKKSSLKILKFDEIVQIFDYLYSH
jgi:ADP-ribosyl-[dinitrogen reductase] hydrolase